jgi:hypothetical protein
MPYVRCPRCGLNTFSAAYWSNVDHCGRCDTELPRPERRGAIRLLPAARLHGLRVATHGLDVEDAVRERLYGRPRSNIEVEPRQRGSSGNHANQR